MCCSCVMWPSLSCVVCGHLCHVLYVDIFVMCCSCMWPSLPCVVALQKAKDEQKREVDRREKDKEVAASLVEWNNILANWDRV